MRKRGWPPPLRVEIKGPDGAAITATIFFDGPHRGKCATCGGDARCGLWYDDRGEPVPPDAVYVTGGEEPWMFHLECPARGGEGR